MYFDNLKKILECKFPMEKFELLLNVSLWLLHDRDAGTIQTLNSKTLLLLSSWLFNVPYIQLLLRTQLLLASNLLQLGPFGPTLEMPTRWKSNTVIRKTKGLCGRSQSTQMSWFLSSVRSSKIPLQARKDKLESKFSLLPWPFHFLLVS